MVPRVPGYRTGRMLGYGATGQVWAAVGEHDEGPVALKVLRGGPDDAAQVLAETALLRRLEHPHVVRLRTVADVPGHGPVLVLDRALGGSLAALVRARGGLDVGEVVTVLAPLAGALADLHEQGLVHGDVAPGNVLFDGRGAPLLGDLSAARVVGQEPGEPVGTPGFADPALLTGARPAPASDVYGLAAAGWLALTGDPPPSAGERPPLVALVPGVPEALVAVLEQALDASPERRPTARELAARCFDAAPAVPVRLVPTDPAAAPAEVVTHRLRVAAASATEPEGRRGRRGRHLRRPRGRAARLVLGGTAVGLLVGAGGWAAAAGVLPGGLPGSAPDPAAVEDLEGAGQDAAAPDQGAPDDEPAETEVPEAVLVALAGDDPRAAVPALAWLRARAFSTDDAQLLARASTAGGEALAADLERLEQLRAGGVRLDGLGFDVRAVEVVEHTEQTAVLDASVVTSAHRQVDASGAVLAQVPEGEPRTSRLRLERDELGAWRVAGLG